MLLCLVVPQISSAATQSLQGQLNPNRTGFTNPISGDLIDIIFRIILFLLSLAAALALAAIVIGGIYYIVSFGNEDRAKTGKTAILYAIFGLIIIGSSFLIVTTIYALL